MRLAERLRPFVLSDLTNTGNFGGIQRCHSTRTISSKHASTSHESKRPFNFFSSTMPIKQVQTFAFLDLETTGLIEGTKMPRVTEISVVALPRHSMYVNSVNKTSPRDTQAISILVNPQRVIPPFVGELTGICNELVANQRPFDVHVYELLNTFINRFKRPICLLSHNGDEFEFPILVWELGLIGKRLADDLLCLDTLDVFRDVMQPPNCSEPPNYKLRTVYTHLMRTEQPNAHRAMGDCLALMSCALSLVDPFVEWADCKARPLLQFTKWRK